jgi:carbon starvation protein
LQVLENAALVTLFCFAALVVAYFTYGRFIARKVYRLQAERPTPAHTMRDGIDYVPTRPSILFGHHFASIAGLGPILGPAIAVIWGWLPALVWVVLGSIFIGAVHDLGALVLSLRHQGRSIGDICRHVIGPRARFLALLIIFFLMSLAMGSFCNAIADLFINYNPDAIIPAGGLMVVAVLFGMAVYRFRLPLGICTVVAIMLFAGLVLWGVEQPVPTYKWLLSAETREMLAAAAAEGEAAFAPPYGAVAAARYLEHGQNPTAAAEVKTAVETANYAWIGALLAYGFLASVLPVWLLLQPRDYINSFQLYFALFALLTAALSGAAENQLKAPMLRTDVPEAPMLFPFLFVTIACGAVSGFHSLVSSGTTVKQLNRETDALPIAYGAMLVEGALAILVIMACAAGLGAACWGPQGTYSSWAGIGRGGLAAQLDAVVRGGAGFLAQLGIPASHGRTFLAVTITAFALTTLDSATRLLRFNVEELCRSLKLHLLANRYFASAVAIGGIAFFALVPAGKALWILFGTSNQLLAGLALLTVSVFLFKLGRPVLYTLVPMVIMLVMSLWAMVLNLGRFWREEKVALAVVSLIVLVMSLWLVFEAIWAFARRRGDLAAPAEDGAPEK